ncbi:MAG TPA: hypothetical protein PKD85_11415 [Saprospiraceae bacterium]|nr:hypothetical protein [Saprospiraceae bacterium]
MNKTIVIFLLLTHQLIAQKTKTVDLYKLQSKEKLSVVNREIKSVEENGKKFVRVSEAQGEGIVWLPVKNFKKGTLEIEMRGKDVLQRSFIGVVFHAQNDSTFDAVYCRPFNFFAQDSIRRIHAVQYISHPEYTWQVLRNTRNAEFEKEIISPPDPNSWFTMSVEINEKAVKTYINKASQPSLVVNKLTKVKNGKIGIFVGSGSGGDFSIVRIL